MIGHQAPGQGLRRRMRWRMSIALDWLHAIRSEGDPRNVMALVSVLASLYRDVADNLSFERRENDVHPDL